MGNGIQRIERRVKLHDLRVLMAVVERGSMAKAAESLATSQPAISRSIADLEFSLGVRLLDRGPLGVAPTPYGRALIRRGIAIFDALKQGVRDIEFLADPTAGEVRIAAPMGWGAGFVATVIDRLARRYPRVVCHLTICASPALVLEQRQVDLVVTRGFAIPPAEDHLQGELLFADSIFVIAGIKNPWARRHRIKLADLINEPWALPPPHDQAHRLLTDVFRAMGLELPRPAMVTATGIARIALVAKGHFLSMASESVLRFGGWERSIKVLPINLAANGGVVGIITLKNRTVTPVAQLFIDCARGGKASGKAPMPAASGLSDGFRRILPVPARSGGGRLAERTPAVQPRRRERVKLPLTGHRVITLRRDSGLGAAYCRCSGLLRRAGDRSARAVLRRGLIIQAKNLISCAT